MVLDALNGSQKDLPSFAQVFELLFPATTNAIPSITVFLIRPSIERRTIIIPALRRLECSRPALAVW